MQKCETDLKLARGQVECMLKLQKGGAKSFEGDYEVSPFRRQQRSYPFAFTVEL